MIHNDGHVCRSHQEGIALLVLAILIAFTISAYYFSKISMLEIEIDNDKQTSVALAKAKQALLAYVATNWQSDGGRLSLIGQLPCPDLNTTNPEGEQSVQCGTAYANGIGYFPWRTLNIDALYDGDGECLLYAVSPAYKSAPVAAVNPDSFGQFQVVNSAGVVIQGIRPEERPVAVIFAAGKVLGAQARTHVAGSKCGQDYGNIAAYLDNDGTTNNAAIDPSVNNVIDQFVQRYDGSEQGVNPLNDSLITVTYEELWQALESDIKSAAFDTAMKNLTEAITMCFAAYGNDLTNIKSNLPMPAAINLNGGEYRRNSDYDDSAVFTSAFAGRLPYDVSNATSAIAGMISTANIFSNAFCDNLNLPSTAAVEDIHFSDDLGSDSGEYFDLWQNWKDHFFYAVSEHYKPDGDGSTTACSGDCVTVNGTEYAAIVFFAGLEQAGQHRYAPPLDGAFANDGVDDKDDLSFYLENNNDTDFPDNTGNAVYEAVNGAASNDVMFCIKTDMSVVECL